MQELATRLAFAIAFLPIALLLIWLAVPWWGVSITIGLFLFLLMAQNELAAAPTAFLIFLVASVVLTAASFAVAQNVHESIDALVNDRSLYKHVRRLPEYALTALTLSIATGATALVRRLRTTKPGSASHGT